MKKFITSIVLMVLASFQIIIMANAVTNGPLVLASVSTNPMTIAPGTDGYIQLTLKNTGNAVADDVKISSFSLDPSIIPYGNWMLDLGALGIGDSTTALLKFSIPSAASSGLYMANFAVDYCQSSVCRTVDSNVIINVESPSVLELVSIEPSSLRAGERTNITFRIANRGDIPIHNVVFTWTSSGNTILPVGSDNRVTIPVINPNSYYDVQVEVSASPSATPGIYPLGIYMQYAGNSGGNQNISSTAGVEITGETDFHIDVQDSTGTSTTFAITNIGSNTAYSLIANIPQQDNYRTTGTSATVLGNLNAGDYTLASFQITRMGVFNNTSEMSGRAPPTGDIGTNPSAGVVPATTANRSLVFEISYTDALGTRRTVQKEVTMLSTNSTFSSVFESRTTQFNPLQMLGSNGITYIVIGVIGIVAIALFFKFGRKIKRKNQ